MTKTSWLDSVFWHFIFGSEMTEMLISQLNREEQWICIFALTKTSLPLYYCKTKSIGSERCFIVKIWVVFESLESARVRCHVFSHTLQDVWLDGVSSWLAHLVKFSAKTFQVRRLQSVLAFSILFHPCSFMVYHYLFSVSLSSFNYHFQQFSLN